MPDRLAANFTFFDYGLHVVPKNLRQTIQRAIDSIEQSRFIVLGYYLYGNGLDNINTGKHSLLIPRTNDCIAILLGSYQACIREMKKGPGTYYLAKGRLAAGTNPLTESRKYEEKYDAETAAYQMDSQDHHDRRLTMVARNEQDLETYRPQAQEVAAYYARWNMHYEEMFGMDDNLRRLAEIAIGLK